MKLTPLSILTLILLSPSLFADKLALIPGDSTGVAKEQDWPWWRGPARNGLASPDQSPPLTWSDKENVVWKTPIPGRGHGSAAIVGERIFLVTADKETETQSVIALDRATGKQLWQTAVHKGGFETKGHAKSSLASSTPACDGERVFVNFLNGGSIWASALSLSGEILWQERLTEFATHQGFGASPAIYESLVICSADNQGKGAVIALDRATGKRVWQVDRPKLHNYTSPMIHHVADKDQLVMVGCDLVSSYEPLTGKKIWEIKGATTECVTSTITDGKRIFTSGGYPRNHLEAVEADGSGKIAWSSNSRVYVPSLMVRDGYLYGVLDAGVAMCWNSATGKESWKHRLSGTFSSSPVMVGETIFATNEEGLTFVFKATPDSFEKLSENQLGDEAFSTPTICGSRIYTRVAFKKDDQRQEFLYCLGDLSAKNSTASK